MNPFPLGKVIHVEEINLDGNGDIFLEQFVQPLHSFIRYMELLCMKFYPQSFCQVVAYRSGFIPDDESREGKGFHLMKVAKEDSAGDAENKGLSDVEPCIVQKGSHRS